VKVIYSLDGNTVYRYWFYNGELCVSKWTTPIPKDTDNWFKTGPGSEYAVYGTDAGNLTLIQLNAMSYPRKVEFLKTFENRSIGKAHDEPDTSQV
jgi:hypothetical protein